MTDSRPLPAVIASLEFDDYRVLSVHVTRGALVDAVMENNQLRELVRELQALTEIPLPGPSDQDGHRQYDRVHNLMDELGC